MITALLLVAAAADPAPARAPLGPWLAAATGTDARCTASVEADDAGRVVTLGVADDAGCDSAARAAAEATLRAWTLPGPGPWPVTLVATRGAVRLASRPLPEAVDSRTLRLLSSLALGWPPEVARDRVHRCQVDVVLGANGRIAALAVGGCERALHDGIVEAWTAARWAVTEPVTTTVTTVRFVPESIRRAEQAAARVAAATPAAPGTGTAPKVARAVRRVAPDTPLVGESTAVWERCAVTATVGGDGVPVDAQVEGCTEAWRLQAHRAVYAWRWEGLPPDGATWPGQAVFRVDPLWHPTTPARPLREARYANATLRCPTHPARRRDMAPPTARCEVDGFVDAEGAVRTALAHGCDPIFLRAVSDSLPAWRFGPSAAEEVAQFQQVVHFVAYATDPAPEPGALVCSARARPPARAVPGPEESP